MHNKKDIFLEGIEYSEMEPAKEKEADSFASEILVPKAIEEKLSNVNRYSHEKIVKLSRESDIHPAFLVGRMHYLKIIPHSVGNNLIPSVVF